MEIAPGVHQVEGMRMVNVFVLLGERLTLVDAGEKGSSKAIDRYLRRIGRSLAEVERVVVTHYHTDHVGGLSELRVAYPVEVAAHEADVPFIEGSQPPPWPRTGAVLRAALKLQRLLFKPPAPVPVDSLLRDGSHLELLGGVQVVHTPGHTPGSISLYLPSLRLLLAGDALVNWAGRLAAPPGALTLDVAEARRSIEKLASLDVEVIGFGHGPPLLTGGGERLRRMVGA